jgi:hypothetical protein
MIPAMRSFGLVGAIACALPFVSSCGGTQREEGSEPDHRAAGATSPGVANDGGLGDAAPRASAGEAAATTPVVCRVAQGTDPATRHECAELRERLVVTDPVLTDEDRDGRLAPGDRVHLTVSLADRSGFGFNNYPGLSVELVEPGGRVATVGGGQFYAIGACQKVPVETTATLAKDLAHGATVELVARVTSLSKCEGTNALVVPLVVE